MNAPTMKTELMDAIKYDEPFRAHSIYYAIQQGYVQIDDPYNGLPADMDYDTIKKMQHANILQMCTVKIFTIPFGQGMHAIYLANCENEARAMHFTVYRQHAQRIQNASRRMDVSLYCEETGTHEVIRDMKRRAVEFPCYVGVVGW